MISCSSGPQEQGGSRLANSESPYLREHADNPVDWYPWGDEAFERARKENKPVIVSIGYASCHWCHVMERESFMDSAVAKIMNENFISIKVDREERPDVDQQFIYAAQVLTGNAGWPLNAFALADGKPFHTITYYPKDAWIELLNKVSAAWKDDSEKLKKQATGLATNMKPLFEFQHTDTLLRLDLGAFVNSIGRSSSSLDLRNGGVKGEPKFPMPSVLELMLQHSRLTGDSRSMQWVDRTLHAMADGGIYDQIGGGFSRYSTDSLWRIPHFEKMLYDNALLLSVYSKAYKLTKDERYDRMRSEIVRFVKTGMTIADSAFISSMNADSEGEEGKYYEWTADEFRKVLGSDAGEAMKYFGVSEEGKSVLRIDDPKKGNPSWNEKLLKAREQRVPPSLDQKIITSWNAMMIIGLLDAAEPDAALQTGYFLDNHMVKGDRVYRSMLNGKPSVEGYLEDYAWLAKAYIALYQSNFDIEWLQKARTITDIAVEKFRMDNSPFFYYSAKGADSRVIRNTEVFDQAIPSSNSVFAEVLLLLGEYYQEPRYTTLAENAIKEMISSLDIDITSISNWARLAQMVEFGPYEIAITGPASNAQAYARDLGKQYLPAAIFMGGDKENLPLLENKLIEGSTIIYVCRNRVCKLPVKDPESALRQIVYK